MATWLMINGSPRRNGNSARLVRRIEALVAERYSSVELITISIADLDVSGCNGCEYCRTQGECNISDDMTRVIELLASVGRVIVVTPIYFAGVPSQFKALLDRLQPLFWKRETLKRAGSPLPEKRPVSLFVLGEGGDPHGFEPLIATLRSALALADLKVERVTPLIGSRPDSLADDIVLFEG